ncbi:MAG: Ni/Fe hydrogenase subunit alpha [Acidobacteria bacterium]|nr:Ni/Fe hydrogenase subunit alpha [Acidobacteriota bacterium]MCW5970794.1 Ni/Fe hydrogenase subunit alpha [Blastocatellales bacterium]
MANRTIKVDYITRVEGEGALRLKAKNGAITDVQLKIFEPPRFFEALLRGKNYNEAHDITSRICGICPVAYQMSAVHAMENALGVEIDPQVRALRRLMYCGEWIESHALHVYLLHAPDFLGYDDGIAMAKDHRAEVERGLQLKKAGNELIALLGGREIHPVNVRVGGFYRAPEKRELTGIAEKLKWAREAALQTVQWTATLPFPDFEQDYDFVALRHPEQYPFNEGNIVSNRGHDIAPQRFDEYFDEEHVKHSTALHGRLRDRDSYLVGPLARYSLNFDRLSATAQEAAHSAGLRSECRNIFQSIIVRAVEMVYACDEALRIIDGYEKPERAAAPVELRASEGRACTEAPRGMLYHRYRLDETGHILEARIIPPTSQNQRSIESDLRRFAGERLDLPDRELARECERTVRSYDPCISCATHFLKFEIERE